MQDQYWSRSLACSTEVCLSMVAVVAAVCVRRTRLMRATNPPEKGSRYTICLRFHVKFS